MHCDPGRRALWIDRRMVDRMTPMRQCVARLGPVGRQEEGAVGQSTWAGPQRPAMTHRAMVVLRACGRMKKQIIPLLARGLSNAEIADEIGTTEQVIKNLTHELFQMTGTKSRLDLVIWSMVNGVVPCACSMRQVQ